MIKTRHGLLLQRMHVNMISICAMRAIACTDLFWYLVLRLRRLLLVLRTTCKRQTSRVIRLCVDIVRAPHLQMYWVVASYALQSVGNRQSFNWGREPLSRRQTDLRRKPLAGQELLKVLLINNKRAHKKPPKLPAIGGLN